MDKSKLARKSKIVPVTSQIAEQLLLPILDGRKVALIESVSTGLVNTTYKIHLSDESKLCLKIYQRGADFGKIETFISQEMKFDFLPRSLLSGSSDLVDNLYYSAYEWVDGERLDIAHGGFAYQKRKKIYSRLIDILKKLSSVRFERTGLLQVFDDGLKVGTNFSLDTQGLLDYATNVFKKENVSNRVDVALQSDFLDWVQNETSSLANQPEPCLSHGDFGPENFLCSGDSKVWAIDWEFACSGNILVDIGHLFRNPLIEKDDLSILVEEAFPSLKNTGWQRTAAILDIFAWLDFVGRDDVPVDVHKNAISKIRAIMKM